jgi:hypothetical protein
MVDTPLQPIQRKFRLADIVPWLQRFEDKFDKIQKTYDDRIDEVEKQTYSLAAKQDSMCEEVVELKRTIEPLKTNVTILTEQVRVLNEFVISMKANARWLIYLVAGILITSLVNIILHP